MQNSDKTLKSANIDFKELRKNRFCYKDPSNQKNALVTK